MGLPARTPIAQTGIGSDVRDKLGTLPEGLEDTYKDIYSDIQRQKGGKVDFALCALQWIMVSPEPMEAGVLIPMICRTVRSEG